MIKNIIFDLGGVLIDHDMNRTLKKMNLPKEKEDSLYKLIRNDDIWNNLDSGKILEFEDALKDMLNRNPNEKEDISKFFDLGYMKDYRTYEKGLSLFRRFKKEGYKIYLLTNFSKGGFATINSYFDFFNECDGILVSYKVKLIKPDHRIYRLLIEKYDLMAEECLFLDDRKSNVDAAKEVGIHAIVYDENTIDERLREFSL